VDFDKDGVLDTTEDAHPNNGDGNADGIADSQQPDVASFMDSTSRRGWVTLEVIPTALSPTPELRSVLPEVGLNFLQAANPPSLVNGLNFIHGFVGFRIVNVDPGDSINVRMTLPADEQPTTYFQYGATPADPADHLYEFLFETATGTGAKFNGNKVMLHFVDGGRGDADLLANGVISDPGAVALPAPVASTSGGGGGCSLQTTSGSPWQAGAWWLLGLCLLPVAVRRAYRHLH
jgi:hypothetical protein